ncbi:MAG TPA: permease-like cell division protein FtsX [Kofleriaceae bacterium]|nr:permease-like cell division protein FtsX [Kofleriaceae bacterium]
MIGARIASALRRTARIAVERPRQTIWTLLALTAALIAVGLAGLTAEHVGRWTSKPAGGASMVVYLGDGVDEPRARQLVAELTKLPGVEHAELVPATESAARLQQALGADSQLLEGVELASLPGSVEVTLAPGVRDVIAMSPMVRALRGTPGVDDVVVEDAGSERVASTLGVVRIVAWTGAALLAGLALLIVLATTRVQLSRGQREREVARLLGASPSFTIVPTALAGALQGTFAAGLAALALYIGVSLYGDSIGHTLSNALGHVEVAVPALSMVAAFIGLGAGLGALGGGLAGAARAVR